MPHLLPALFDSLPSVPGHTWRVLEPADARALRQLQEACTAWDGATYLLSQDEWRAKIEAAVVGVAAANPKNEIGAYGLVTNTPGPDSERAFLEGRIHPRLRGQGIGTALLRWLEMQGRQMLAGLGSERRLLLRIMFWDRGPDAKALFEQQGFRLLYVEEELRTRLSASRFHVTLPPACTLEYWTPATANDFYRVYRDAFATRTERLLDRRDWCDCWTNPNDPEFAPRFSLLMRCGAEPVAALVGHLYERDAVHIAQFGVRPAWRRRGLGTTLLRAALDCYADAGYRWATLMVNIDNPAARRLYQKTGFRPSKRLTMYEKPVHTP
ncbi:MAG: GNAT family N-acetyltransferase [Caldilineae bacterium]|nr:MAG: GNAT family N-acetyltransferase [Caldilineae bacterium]